MKRFAIAATALLASTLFCAAQEPGSLPETKATPAHISQNTQPTPQPTNQNGAIGPATTTAQPAPVANSGKAPRNPKASRTSKAPMEETPGGGPDKVWVNTNSSVYHCPGDRFYGKTAHGRYMTEPAARSAGAKGVGGKTCFAGK